MESAFPSSQQRKFHGAPSGLKPNNFMIIKYNFIVAKLFIMGYLNTVSLLAETSEFSSIIKRAYVRASHTPQSCLVLLPSVSRNFNVAKW